MNNAFFDETMPCSLVVFKNDTDRKIEPHEQLLYARQAGLDFIMLKAAKGVGGMKFSLRSFQRCTVEVSTSRGEVIIRKEWDSTRDGSPRRGGQLWFDRDKMGIYKAPLLDSEMNRDVLASVYFAHNRPWDIIDPEMDRTIRQLAIDNGYDKAQRPVDVQSVVRGQEDENLRLRREIDRLAAEKKELADRVAILGSGAAPERPAEQPAKRIGRPPKDKGLRTPKAPLSIEAQEMKNLKDKARRQVYEENPEIVARLRDTHKSAWAFSPEYQEKLSPLITERLERFKREHTEPVVHA
jgi:hypothetical protein